MIYSSTQIEKNHILHTKRSQTIHYSLLSCFYSKNPFLMLLQSLFLRVYVLPVFLSRRENTRNICLFSFAPCMFVVRFLHKKTYKSIILSLFILPKENFIFMSFFGGFFRFPFPSLLEKNSSSLFSEKHDIWKSKMVSKIFPNCSQLKCLDNYGHEKSTNLAYHRKILCLNFFVVFITEMICTQSLKIYLAFLLLFKPKFYGPEVKIFPTKAWNYNFTYV